jgi:hypothetical protein
MVGDQAGSQEMQWVPSLTSRSNEMTVWHVLKGLLQVEHDVEAM